MGGHDARAIERRESLGEAIKRFRGDRTQADLGKAVGVPQTTVSRWEAGTVDLGLEQIRKIERALDVPLGTLGRASGYVDPALTGDEHEWPGFRCGLFDSLAEAKDELEAAAKLGLGVRIFNRWSRETADGARSEEWVVVLYEEPYEVNE